jgi:predicted metal-dependent phosphoesterase TrpH
MTLRADLHVHTTYSDNFSTPLQVLRTAARRGLDAVAITDHDTIEGALEAAVAAQSDPSLPTVIIGEEVSSSSGHILGLFLQQRVEPGLSAADTVAAIHAQGGLAIAAHPFWRVGISSLGTAFLDALPLDGMEVANGAPVPSMQRANALAARHQSESGLSATGGSDAHHALAVGWSHTCFPGDTDIRLAHFLRAALANGTTHPGRLFVNPFDLAHYAVRGLRSHGHGLFRVAF